MQDLLRSSCCNDFRETSVTSHHLAPPLHSFGTEAMGEHTQIMKCYKSPSHLLLCPGSGMECPSHGGMLVLDLVGGVCPIRVLSLL